MGKWLIPFAVAFAATAAAELDQLPRGLEEANRQGVMADLGQIRERGFIRVLTRNNPACYFMHRGVLMGFEYDLVQRFAKQQGIEVVVIVPDRWSDMGQWLEEGRADVIAACLTITSSRSRRNPNLQYCHPYGEVFETIVGRADEPYMASPAELEGRTLHVRRSSSYYESLEALRSRERLDFRIEAVPEDEESFQVMEKVAGGEYDLTCVDVNFLDQGVRLGNRIKPVYRLDQPRAYGWGVRNDQPQLKAAIDAFFEKETRSAGFAALYRRYFDRAANQQLDETFNFSAAGRISPYDDLVKMHAATYGFPWTLVCSQMFQESSFRPDAVSRSGAQGLMQLMPPTAREMGLEDPFDPGDNIRAGTHYLRKQYDRIPEEVGVVDRTCFALASYNGGYGHLIDARNLARQMGKDPNVWVDNVDQAYALLSEPDHARRAKYGYCRSDEIIGYVRKIMSRYIAYDAAVNAATR